MTIPMRMTKCKCILTKFKERCENPVDFTFPDAEKYEKEFDEHSMYILKNVFMSNESILNTFIKIAIKFCLNCEHAKNMVNIFLRKEFFCSTPIVRCAMGIDSKPISCYITSVGNWKRERLWDQLSRIIRHSLSGGGMGADLSKINDASYSKDGQIYNGVLNYTQMLQQASRVVSTKLARPSIIVVWTRIQSKDVLDVINIRECKSTDGSDIFTHVHVGIVITDDFMEAVKDRKMWYFTNVDDPTITGEIEAVILYGKIIQARTRWGIPYLFFKDIANETKPKAYKDNLLEIEATNMCTEIAIATGVQKKHEEKFPEVKNNPKYPEFGERDAICCLGSMNMRLYYNFKDNDVYFVSIFMFLDGVIEYYIETTKCDTYMKPSVYTCEQSRPIGIGALGLSSLFQSKGIAYDSQEAEDLNEEIFKHLAQKLKYWNSEIGKEIGACPDCKRVNITDRFLVRNAIAPNSYLALFLNESMGCQPSAVVQVMKTSVSKIIIKNNELTKLIIKKFGEERLDEIWEIIIKNGGTIQNLDLFTEDEKKIFKDRFEIKQIYVIRMAAKRKEVGFTDQGESLNLWIIEGMTKAEIGALHFEAYKTRFINTLYYLNTQPARNISINAFAGAGGKDCLSCVS